MPNFSNPSDSKEKSHECQFCDKKYFSRNALRNHERLKHEGKGKRTDIFELTIFVLKYS